MAVSYSSNRVTIGALKTAVTASSGSNNVVAAAPIFDAGDVGRFIAVVPSATDSSTIQVRRITALVSNIEVTVHDQWLGGAPAIGTTFRVSHNLNDVHALANGNLNKIGEKSYQWNADWTISTNGFLADVDCSLEMQGPNLDPAWPIANGGIVQFGVLWGGENNNSTETTNGCNLLFKSTFSNNSIYSATNARIAGAGIVNYYGCLIDSRSSVGWMFQRMNSAARFIGCVQDGIMGGRFYHEKSEWADCRVSGNNDPIPPFSLGASFTRSISNVNFYKNSYAVKTYSTFVGTFRNCVFSNSNTYIASLGGNGNNYIIDFIDCSTFSKSKIIGSNNTLRQSKSISYVTVNSNDAGVSGVKVSVVNKNNTLQSGVKVSDTNGVVPEILATFSEIISSTVDTLYSPFLVRIRKYGYLYSEFTSSVPDKINQNIQMRVNPALNLIENDAGAITGIAIDSPTKAITFSSGSATSSNLYDYSQWWLYQTANMQISSMLTTDNGINLTLDAQWKLVIQTQITGGIDLSGTVELTQVINLENINCTTLILAAAGTYDFTDSNINSVVNTSAGSVVINKIGSTSIAVNTGPNITINEPIQYGDVLISNIVPASRLQIVNVTTSTETVNIINAGTTYSLNYANGSGYTVGDIVRVRLTYCNGLTAKKQWEQTAIVGASGFSVFASQVDDNIYITNGIDGSTVTEYAADYLNVQIDVASLGSTTTIQRGYAWYCYAMTGDLGIAAYFGAMVAEDEFNYLLDTNVLDIKIQNTDLVNGVTMTGGALRRRDGSSPIAAGGSIYIYYGRTYAIETGASGVTAGDIADISSNVAASVPTTNDFWAHAIEGLTAEEMMRVMLSALAGKREGLGTTTEQYMAQDGMTPRITLTPDVNGNGTPIINGTA